MDELDYPPPLSVYLRLRVRLAVELERHGPYRLLLLIIVVVAAALRYVGLGAVGLNSDESVYAGQAASLAGNPRFDGLFPIVRAHPLLTQILMSPLYRDGTPDTVGRYLTALFGVGTVLLVFAAGAVLYDRRVGVVAAALLAVMPYHVVISRQIMLDGPMTFFSTAAVLCLALAASGPKRRRWLVACGAMLGLAALSKEIAIVLVGSLFVFLSLENRLWRPVRFPLIALILTVGLAFSYPVLTVLSGGSSRGQSYLIWQLTRQPNHSFYFYLLDVGGSIGFGILAAALLGLFARRWSGRSATWRETLLISWLAIPVLFFEMWPVKGFSYLLPLAPVLVVLAARAVVPIPELLRTRTRKWVSAALVAALMVAAAVPSVLDVIRPPSTGLAGAGGLPGGRETGRWIAQNTPGGASFLTIGPSMANLIMYYSGRRADGLSVSPNPLHRNPAYQAVVNADADLRNGDYQYVVWDAYSARRSQTFSERATELVHRFNGAAVHYEYGAGHGKNRQAIVVVYEVTP